MKKVLLLVLAGAAIAYGAYRYFGVVPELQAKDAEQAKKTLDRAREQAADIEKQAARRAQDAVKATGTER